MVHIKVSNGVETRRFEVTEELTFEQLREKLIAVGIVSSPTAESLQLQYRDSDGDVITISSDEELRIALSGLPSDAVLRLYVRRSTTPRGGGQRHSLLEDFFSQSTNFWDNFEKHFNTSILEKFWGNDGNRSDSICSTKPSEEEVKSKSAAPEPRRDESKVEESKPSQSENGPSPIRSHVVVSWEPRVQYTWFGPCTVLRPVRYNVLYLEEHESNEKPTEKTANDETKTTPEAAPQETAGH